MLLLLFNLGFQHSKLLGRVGLSNEGPEKVNLLDLPSALKINIFHPLKNGRDLVFWMMTNQPQSLMLMYFLKFL